MAVRRAVVMVIAVFVVVRDQYFSAGQFVQLTDSTASCIHSISMSILPADSMSDIQTTASHRPRKHARLDLVNTSSIPWYWLHSTVGRTSVLGRPAFTVLSSTCSWRMTIYVRKPSTAGQPTRPTQPFILSGSIKWIVSNFIGCALVAPSGECSRG